MKWSGSPGTPAPVSGQAPALASPVIMNQDWRDLTFLHWAADPHFLEGFMPPGAHPDTFEGRSYVGLIPFLTARWGLQVRYLGRTRYVPNAHPPWPLRDAEVIELDDGLMRSVGLGNLGSRPPDHVAFSEGVHTEFGLPERI